MLGDVRRDGDVDVMVATLVNVMPNSARFMRADARPVGFWLRCDP
jgi:hypothetical protein